MYADFTMTSHFLSMFRTSWYLTPWWWTGIRSICTTSWGQKSCSTSCIFQHILWWSISSQTLIIVQVSGLLLIGWCLKAFGIQLSSQILINLPFLTLHFVPFSTTPLAPNQLFYNHKSFPFCWNWKNCWLGKHLPFNTRTQLGGLALLSVAKSILPKVPHSLISGPWTPILLLSSSQLISPIFPNWSSSFLFFFPFTSYWPFSFQFVCKESWIVCSRTYCGLAMPSPHISEVPSF